MGRDERDTAGEAFRFFADEGAEGFRIIFEQSPDPMFLRGLDGGMLEVNQAGLTLFGYATRDELLAVPVQELVALESVPLAAQRVRDLVSGKTLGERVVYTARCRDGSVRLIEAHSTLLRHAGRPHVILTLARDVTEAHRVASRLERMNACLLGFGSDFTANASAITAACGELLGASFALYSRIDGDRLAQVAGWSLPSTFPPRFRIDRSLCGQSLQSATDLALLTDLQHSPFAETVQSVRVYGLTAYLGHVVRRGGAPFGVLCVFYTTPFVPTLDDERLLGIMAAALGAEETRCAAEQALRDSEEKYRRLVMDSTDPVFSLDRDCRYVFVNETFARLIGKSPEMIVGQTPRDLFPPDQAEGRVRAIAEVFATGDHREIETFVDAASGERRYHRTVLDPVKDESGEVVSVSCIARDITDGKKAEEERQRLQEQLQQAMKMEAVGRLAGGVAHDFNNLLTVIKGNVSCALGDLRSGDPLAHLLVEVDKAADRAAALTRQLLAFSRKQIVQPRAIDLNDLVANIHRMLVRVIGEDVSLHTISAADLSAVKVDPGQFEQILMNLAVNARDAMPEGGTLVLETSNVTLDEEYCRRHAVVTPGPFVMLAVSDTGHGMTDEVKAHLFEPFFTTKPTGRGTGLGLATTYGAVRQAGGSLEVYSEPGRGTTFKIYLPAVAEPPESLQGPPTRTAASGGTETILLVEDDEGVRGLAVRLLAGRGYQVIAAANGAEALDLAERHAGGIHLLMTDVVMPGMNGRELANRLRRERPDVAVLYTSGYTENVIVHHGVVEEGLSFIGKPYTPLALAEKVRSVLDRGSAT